MIHILPLILLGNPYQEEMNSTTTSHLKKLPVVFTRMIVTTTRIAFVSKCFVPIPPVPHHVAWLNMYLRCTSGQSQCCWAWCDIKMRQSACSTHCMFCSLLCRSWTEEKIFKKSCVLYTLKKKTFFAIQDQITTMFELFIKLNSEYWCCQPNTDPNDSFWCERMFRLHSLLIWVWSHCGLDPANK